MKAPYINPFLVAGYQGPEYFCNRTTETQAILQALNNGRNIALISIRRLGKTALIHHAFHHLRNEKRLLIYADLMPTNSIADFNMTLCNALVAAIPEKSVPGKKIWDWIKHIRPQISFDPYTGLPQITFDAVRPQEQQQNLIQLLYLLEEIGRKTIIALDEFQQITQYDQANTESWLRSVFQKLTSIQFIYAGSQQHLLTEMFHSAKRPFYASAQIITLKPIEQKDYRNFIMKHMKNGGKNISTETADYIIRWCFGHTFYVQHLCNRIYGLPDHQVNEKTVHSVIKQIFKENEAVYFTYRDLLTQQQWNVLSAIAKAETVYEPTAKNFIQTYRLGTPASVKRALDALTERDMIYKNSEGGKSYYRVYDVFLSRWLEYTT